MILVGLFEVKGIAVGGSSPGFETRRAGLAIGTGRSTETGTAQRGPIGVEPGRNDNGGTHIHEIPFGNGPAFEGDLGSRVEPVNGLLRSFTVEGTVDGLVRRFVPPEIFNRLGIELGTILIAIRRNGRDLRRQRSHRQHTVRDGGNVWIRSRRGDTGQTGDAVRIGGPEGCDPDYQTASTAQDAGDRGGVGIGHRDTHTAGFKEGFIDTGPAIVAGEDDAASGQGGNEEEGKGKLHDGYCISNLGERR